MSKDPVLASALSDVARIRSWCSANAITELPHRGGAVAYLATNAEVLAFFVSALYDGTTEQERTALYEANHGRLDYSVINTATRGLAESTLQESIQEMAGNLLLQVTDDDVVMLLRVLEYVPHIDARPRHITLPMSPLQLP